MRWRVDAAQAKKRRKAARGWKGPLPWAGSKMEMGGGGGEPDKIRENYIYTYHWLQVGFVSSH